MYKEKAKRLFIIDASSFIFRSYHAMPNLRASDGTPTGAVYGFVTMLQSLLNEYTPEYLLVAFDRPEPTFRREMYEDYKANRVEPPEELIPQLGLIREAVDALRIPSWECAGMEADDLIGTVSYQAAEESFEVTIVTGDKDLLQLVGPKVKVLQSHFRNSKMYRAEDVRQRYKCTPESLPDLFGLMGDSVDNIPGVPGIGEKTAVALIEHYETLDRLYDHLDEIRGKRQEKLRDHKEQAFLSRDLARIRTDVPWQGKLEDCRRQEPDQDRLIELFERLEFRTLLSKMPQKEGEASGNPGEYRVLKINEELEVLVSRIVESGGMLALDTETTGFDTTLDNLVGISLSLKSEEAFYIPVGHLQGPNIALRDVQKILGPLLANSSIPKCGHHLKFDSIFLDRAGLPLKGIQFDTLIASALLEPGQDSHKLDDLARVHAGMTMTPITTLIGKGKKQISMAEVDVETAGSYACEDADASYRLYEYYRDKMKDDAAENLFHEVEMPLIEVLASMEKTGVMVDREELARQSREIGADLERIEQAIFTLAGVTFNLNSPKQLGEVLYDKLALPSGRKRSTAIGVLEKLARAGSEIATLLIEYRQLVKLKSTYLDALPTMIHPTSGRIHTSYHQTGAATGRISSSRPNLQNIPVRTDLGRKIRKAFRASEGCRLLSADYSQVELRILAHLAQDPGLIRAFNEGVDIHSFTARQVFGIPPEVEVTSEDRRRAKAINFGLNYGMTAYGLAQRLGIDKKEAAQYMDQYFSRYPRVLEYVETAKQQAHQQGYVITLMGRRIPTPGVRSSNAMQREAAERAAINAPIQGAAADLIKKAMLACYRAIDQEKLSSRMILTVHDEIVFECPEEEMARMRQLAREVMESVMTIQVPLNVDMSEGITWAEL
jgi:DNA polymerase-1